MEEIKPQIRHQEIGISIFNIIASIDPTGIGSVLQESLYAYAGRVKQERLNLFTENLKEYFEKENKDEIDTEFLRSSDFGQFFEQTLRKVVENKSERKLIIFRDIFINNIKAKNISDFSETFLNIVAQLHEKQIEILKTHLPIDNEFFELKLNAEKLGNIIRDLNAKLPEEKVKASHGFANDVNKIESDLTTQNYLLAQHNQKISLHRAKMESLDANFFNLEENIYSFYLQDLVSKCLLVDVSYSHFDSTKPFSDTLITEFGKELLKFIEAK
jgi:hypothetical protein